MTKEVDELKLTVGAGRRRGCRRGRTERRRNAGRETGRF